MKDGLTFLWFLLVLKPISYNFIDVRVPFTTNIYFYVKVI